MPVNAKRSEVAITLGGEIRTLRIDFNALALLEQMHGMAVTQLAAPERLGIRVVRDVLYVGLVSKGENVTPEKVGEWMSDDPTRLGEWSLAVKSALISALGIDLKPEEKKKEDDGKGPFVDGSSPSGSTTTSS